VNREKLSVFRVEAMKKVTLLTAFLLVVLMDASIADDVRKKVDELFILASSGEVQYRDKVEPAKKELIEMGAEAVPYLVEKLDTENAREMHTLTDILKEIGGPAVLPLIQQLDSENKEVLRTSATILGKIGDPKAAPHLAGILEHPDLRIRSAASTSLGQVGDTTFLGVVVSVLSDSVEMVRKSAAYALGELETPGGISALISAFQDPHYSVRLTAVTSLVKIGEPAVDTLISLLSHPDAGVQYLSIEALGRIKATEAIDPLLAKLKSEHWATRAFAVEALGEIGDKRGIVSVVNLQKDETHPFVLNRIGYVLEKIQH
jgi:HEAT repeat protein